ncbi:hypothetical protein PHLCEN_2v1883 [Hermanssonia centrifuga]|uniref:Uncharacterized protein n=1 Tax=Hermanssonia centrifuga TaxID=98765 RepID=A0A2R6RVP3_9APHY|nr:hypothetical protein PHLCEN_2v1883 [Hermanssonia centrifuga]
MIIGGVIIIRSICQKTGDMAVGQVSFHNDKKTKVERQVDHEQERIERVKEENAVRRAAAAAKVRIQSLRYQLLLKRKQKKADAELAKAREAEKAARSYDTLFSAADEDEDDEEEGVPKKSVREMEEDFM